MQRRRKWRPAQLVCAASLFVGACCIAFPVGMWWVVERSAHPPSQAEAVERADQPAKGVGKPVSADERIADYTLVFAWFTGVLAVVSAFQLYFLNRTDRTARISANAARDAGIQAKRSADIAERALTAVQRAFVYAEPIIHIPIIGDGQHDTIVEWQFWLPWRNSGLTPAMKVECQINVVQRRGPPLPAWFPFWDIKGAINNRFVLGPNEVRQAGPVIMPIDRVMKMYRKEVRTYVYGWTLYSDVFERRHLSRFAVEIARIADDPSKVGPVNVLYAHMQNHNCADTQCDEEDRQIRAILPKNAAELLAPLAPQGWKMPPIFAELGVP
jgi:hypothetical protein